MAGFSTFVALGDSFTEGLDDRVEGGGYGGWADRVADALSTQNPALRYANLAVRGRKLNRISGEQVAAALAMEPDLITIAGGGNDILGPRCDCEDLGRRFSATVTRLASSGATLVVFAGFDPSHRLPLGRRLAVRAEAYNAAVRRAAAEVGAHLVDLWSMSVLEDRRMWGPDRLHLSSEGHRRVAAATLEVLGVDPQLDWRAPLDPVPALPWHHARLEDLRWTREDLAPWIGRHLRGRSSGDLVEPKRPQPYRWLAPQMREVG